MTRRIVIALGMVSALLTAEAAAQGGEGGRITGFSGLEEISVYDSPDAPAGTGFRTGGLTLPIEVAGVDEEAGRVAFRDGGALRWVSMDDVMIVRVVGEARICPEGYAWSAKGGPASVPGSGAPGECKRTR